jgi:RNA polymerase sigma factor (TIGR02999 family)
VSPQLTAHAPAFILAEMTELTQMLAAAAQGDAAAAGQILPLVYDELRRLAASYLQDERAGHTLQPTALVHEAYLRLVGDADGARDPNSDPGPRYAHRGQFFAAAALAMRRILIDNARRKRRDKRGGAWKRVPLSDLADAGEREAEELLALDEALTRLAATDPQAAEVVQLHTFGGLSVEEAGAQLGLSRAAAYRQWAFARAWLRTEMGAADPAAKNPEKS